MKKYGFDDSSGLSGKEATQSFLQAFQNYTKAFGEHYGWDLVRELGGPHQLDSVYPVTQEDIDYIKERNERERLTQLKRQQYASMVGSPLGAAAISATKLITDDEEIITGVGNIASGLNDMITAHGMALQSRYTPPPRSKPVPALVQSKTGQANSAASASISVGVVTIGHYLSQGKATIWARAYSQNGKIRVVAFVKGSVRPNSSEFAAKLEKELSPRFQRQGIMLTVLSSGNETQSKYAHSERMGQMYDQFLKSQVGSKPLGEADTNRIACSGPCKKAQEATNTQVLHLFFFF